MKKLFIAALIFLNPVHVDIQTGTKSGKLYFQVMATPGLSGNTVKTNIHFEDEKGPGRETKLQVEFGKPVKLTSIIDAMHYIERLGLIFINAFPVEMGDKEICLFNLKKHALKTAS